MEEGTEVKSHTFPISLSRCIGEMLISACWKLSDPRFFFHRRVARQLLLLLFRIASGFLFPIRRMTKRILFHRLGQRDRVTLIEKKKYKQEM